MRGKNFRLFKILWIITAVILVAGLLYYTLKLIEPSSTPQNVLFSNITDHQVSISWVTAKPTRSKIYVSKDGKFPFFPFSARDSFRDDGEKNLKKTGFYSTHKVTAGDLEPDQTYQFRIYQDWKRVYDGSFKTGSTLNSINPPNPVYGRVLESDKRTPVVGALIYLQAIHGATPSAALSAMTNKEGRWSIDLGNLRTKDLRTPFKIASQSAQMLIVQHSKGSFKAQTQTGKDKPWPDVILGKE